MGAGHFIAPNATLGVALLFVFPLQGGRSGSGSCNDVGCGGGEVRAATRGLWRKRCLPQGIPLPVAEGDRGWGGYAAFYYWDFFALKKLNTF